MATLIVMCPQTAEQKAVAGRVIEFNAGILLSNNSADGIRTAVFTIVNNIKYKESAEICSKDFRSYSGPKGAAEFIENVIHTSIKYQYLQSLSEF